MYPDSIFPILSVAARERLRHRQSLEGSREGKGEAICAVLYSSIAYVAGQQDRFSEVCHWQTLIRQDILK